MSDFNEFITSSSVDNSRCVTLELLISDSLVEDVVTALIFVHSRSHRFVLIFRSYLELRV